VLFGNKKVPVRVSNTIAPRPHALS